MEWDKFKVEVAGTFGLYFKYSTVGYNSDMLATIMFQFIYGFFTITLPWKHEKQIKGKNNTHYGITISGLFKSPYILIYYGENTWEWGMPFSYVFYSALRLKKMVVG